MMTRIGGMSLGEGTVVAASSSRHRGVVWEEGDGDGVYLISLGIKFSICGGQSLGSNKM